MFALIENDVVIKYPYSFEQLRKDNPQVSFPRRPSEAKLAEFNVYRVVRVQQPEINNLVETLEQGTPEKIDGEWTQVWNVVPLSQEEQDQRAEQHRLGVTMSAVEFRIAAHQAGKLDDIEQLMNHVDTPTPVKITWQHFNEVNRQHPLVQFIGNKLGFTDAQLDNFFGISQTPGANRVPLRIQGSMHEVWSPDGTTIRVGCVDRPYETWMAARGAQIARRYGYTEAQIAEHRGYVQQVQDAINAAAAQ